MTREASSLKLKLSQVPPISIRQWRLAGDTYWSICLFFSIEWHLYHIPNEQAIRQRMIIGSGSGQQCLS